MHRGSLSGAHEDPQPYKFDTWPTKIGPRDELPVSTVMLLPATTYGFNLHEKKWGKSGVSPHSVLVESC